jgi:hypothetical protein
MMNDETTLELAHYAIEELTESLDFIASSIEKLAEAQEKTAQAIFHMAREDGPIEIAGFEIGKSLKLISEAVKQADCYDSSLGDDLSAALLKVAEIISQKKGE